MRVHEVTGRIRDDNPMPSSNATTWPAAVKSAAAAATTAVPSHHPAHTPRQRAGIAAVSAPSTHIAP
jgi:hypothetical protein